MMRYAVLLFAVGMASTDNFFLPDLIDKASMMLLKEAYLDTGASNVVSSPLGVLLLLSLYSVGVDHDTRNEIMTLLGTSNYKAITESYSSLSVKFASMDSSNFTLANKIYVAENLRPTDEFSDAVRSYMSEIDSIDFKNKPAAVATINQWATEKSQGNIKNPVSEETIDDEDTAAVLFNIIFFQGHWDVPFKAEQTKIMDFHVNKLRTVKKEMMHLLRPLYFHESEELGAKLIELPYQEPDFRMVVVLPHEIEGLSKVLDKVTEKGLLQNVLALSPTSWEINLYMPKFDITSKLNYEPILKKVGVKKIFNDRAPGVVENTNVTVSKFFQEAYLKVDEEGAAAGAFTGVVSIPVSAFSSPPKPIDFIIDHPFLFAILHKDVLIFTGTYSD